ncbi:MAG: PQQ-dependent sugar dehydrogenase [Trueperaceae bacterium]|nr:PQQ-dependent sugar dehydrogenase [Trueperaceae bacterium]
MRFLYFSLICLLASLLTAANEQQTSHLFDMDTLLTGLEVPWDLEFDSSGTLYFTERIGRLSRLDNQKKVLASAESFTNLRVEGEAGLMGLALDPQFSENNWLYTCYSAFADDQRINRVSRFKVTDDVLQDERIILDNLPGSGAHNGCRLAFGPDGYLYISMGEAFNPKLAQDPTYLGGKILRIASDGTVPEDNPFGNEVWSLGHRNPQGLVFADDGSLFETEHGPEANDEINLITRGENYGWPEVTGDAPNAEFSQALKSYYPDGTIAIAGLDIYRGTMFPWQGNLLFVSLKAGRFYRLELTSDKNFKSDEILLDRNINSNLGRLRDVEVAPDGSIYLATSNINDRNNAPHPDDDRIVRLKPKQ